MSKKPSFFEPIRRKALQRWNQLESDPELAGPWHQLFKQVQSPRHVLSELLQNADDAGATEASVDISDGCFVFSHNGEDFTAEHFASLCRFGYSNKRALHTIGFRGIGFKSTFSLGDIVELSTPSLSLAFNRQRFTEPVWVDSSPSKRKLTQVRVVISDDRRRREVEMNLQEWLESPVSLLFFKYIRCLRIQNHEMRWASLGPGPVEDTEWMTLNGNPDQKHLLARSSAQAFPNDALSEIRQERLLGIDQEADFPPCKVEIVLGTSGRLYVVLPTGVKTSLPFACNAPFIQDPARLKIKDPETSPTNRWLLEQIGLLAARIMLSWLNQRSLDPADRSGAYSLLPDVELTDNSLEGVCAAAVEESFSDLIAGSDYVLTDTGDLAIAGRSVVIPELLLDVWPAGKATGFLDMAGRPAFSKDVSQINREKLDHWGAIETISRDHILTVLQSTSLPKPKSWRRLLSLWTYVAPSISGYPAKASPKKVRIFPVQGKDELYSAEQIVRLGEKRLLQSDADWDFLAKHLLVLNQNWLRYIAEQRRDADEHQDTHLQEEIHAASVVLKASGIDDVSDVSKVIEKVASIFFAQKSVNIPDCVQIAQIASKLGATLGPSFQFVTRDLYRRSITSVIVYDPDGSMEGLLPENWSKEHLLHQSYSAPFKSCSANEWSQWLSTGRAGLSRFAQLTKKQTGIYGRAKALAELARRGFSGNSYQPFVTSRYAIDDWDFDDVLWKHWLQLSSSDEHVWCKVMEHVLAQPVPFWKSATSASVVQIASTGNTRSITHLPLVPDWILKFRDLPCLPDTRGFLRKPVDLLRRTTETESLIDVEPFIHGRFDTESNRPLLILLDVRNTPTGPERLLDCLRALAKSETPPVHEVEKWYLRLDQMTNTCSTEDLASITQALLQERIVLTESSAWATGASVFLSSDEDDVPGAALIRGAVSDLSLWRKIGMAERPTADRAIAWLKTIPWQEPLTAEDLRRIKALLARHALRIWNECGSWINLAGEWVPKETLNFALTMRSLVPWGHLHVGIKKRTADFQRLPFDLSDSPPFSEIPSLASKLEDRFNLPQTGFGRPERKAWITQLGIEIVRIRLDNDEEESRIRNLAAQLAKTVWQSSPSLEIVPYIDGTPAGTAKDADVVWLDNVLYVKTLPNARLAKLIPDKLGRAFIRPDIAAALSYCFGRSLAEVTEYMEENFTLSDASPTDLKPEPDSANSESAFDDAQQPPTDAREPKESDQAKTISDEDLSESEPRPREPDGMPSGEPAPEPDEQSDGHLKPRQPTKQTKPSVVDRFAQSNGFLKVTEDRYSHPDGSWITRAHGESFCWIRGKSTGEVAYYYWTKDHCLEEEPLQIDAEVWSMVDKFPQNHAFLLSNPEGKAVEIQGEILRKMCDAGKVILYPATYRLVYQNGN